MPCRHCKHHHHCMHIHPDFDERKQPTRAQQSTRRQDATGESITTRLVWQPALFAQHKNSVSLETSCTLTVSCFSSMVAQPAYNDNQLGIRTHMVDEACCYESWWLGDGPRWCVYRWLSTSHSSCILHTLWAANWLSTLLNRAQSGPAEHLNNITSSLWYI